MKPVPSLVLLTFLLTSFLSNSARAEKKLTKAPEMLHFEAAKIPKSESARTSSVATMLRLLIDETGRVVEAEVVKTSTSAALDQAAVEAAKAFLFSPAEIDGVPSPIKILYRYVFAFEPPPPPIAALIGVVRDRSTGEPIPRVRVTTSSTSFVRTTTTSTTGRFAFEELPPGEIEVALEGERLIPVRTKETLAPGERREVSYEVRIEAPQSNEEDDLEIVVTAPAIRRQVVATRVVAEEARRVPGTSGDVVRVVESLPGVARAGVGSGALVVWGAAPEETRVYVDGVPVPRLYHEGGLRSILHSEVVDSIELVPGGAGAAWGRGLAGLVSVHTKEVARPGIHGAASLDLLDGSLALAWQPNDELALAVSGRASLLDRWGETLLGSDVTDYLPIPRYRDGQVRLQFRPAANDRVDVVLLGSSDRFARGVPNSDPALATREERDLDFARGYARWSHEQAGVSAAVTPWIGFDALGRASTFGDIVTEVSARIWSAGLRASYRARTTDWLTLEVGLDAELARSAVERRGSSALPAREGDARVFGQAPPDEIASDDWVVTTIGAAPYGEAEIEIGDLRITPGLRLDPYAVSVSRRLPPEGGTPEVGLYSQHFAAEPRLSLRFAPWPILALRAAFALQHQFPAAEDLSAAFGTPDLPPSTSLHFVAGADLDLPFKIRFEATGFLVLSRELAMRDASDAPLRAEALVPSGDGRNLGVQVLLRKDLDELGLTGWVAYTLMRSERRDRKGEAWRPSDFEQTHVLSAVLSYRLPWQIDLGLRFRYATGFPRSAVTGVFYDSKRDRYQPIFGERNGERIPAFIQLDARISKIFDLAGTELEIFLEVLNVTNTENAEEIVYAADFSSRDYVTSLPILPVLGLRFGF